MVSRTSYPSPALRPRALRPRVLRPLALAAVAVLLAFTAACGGSAEEHTDSPAAGAELTASPQDGAAVPKDAKVVDVTFSGDSVTPQGEQLDLKQGQQLVLDIKADAAGELHVHSTPEKHISYPAGSSQVSFSIDRPGVVEVESHSLDKLVLQLEVR